MTVSIKRWIAIIAMMAMTLAGTPIQTVANDGLDSSRYGFKSQPAKNRVVQARASISQNPFRSNRVSASIVSGVAIVEKAPKVATSYARIIQSQVNFDSSAKSMVAERSNGRLVTPNFGGEDQLSFFESLTELQLLASSSIAKSLDHSQAFLQAAKDFAPSVSEVAEAPRHRVKASTASFRIPADNDVNHYAANHFAISQCGIGHFKAAKSKSSFSSFSTMTTLKSNIIKDAEMAIAKSAKQWKQPTPLKRLARELAAGNMQIAVLPAAQDDPGFDIFAAVGRTIDSISISEATETLKRAIQQIDTEALQEAEVADEKAQDGVENRLLMDSFVPNTNDADSIPSSPSKLSVPAMMISSSTVKHQSIAVSTQVGSVINTAKILVKSVIKIVGPVSALDQAFEFSRKWNAPMFRWDGLNWCTWHI